MPLPKSNVIIHPYSPLFIFFLDLVGEHKLIDQKIAAKIISKADIKNKEMEEKIKREVKFSQHLRHPNIIRIFDVLENATELIFIMEYASGRELYDLLNRGKVNSKFNFKTSPINLYYNNLSYYIVT